jgi:hypothetical protein
VARMQRVLPVSHAICQRSQTDHREPVGQAD